MLVLRGAGQNAAVAGEHVHLDDGVVHEPILERRCLDAHAGMRAAERDRLELRHHARHGAMRERGVGQVDKCGHALGLDDARRRVDAQHLVEVLQIDARPLPWGAIAKEIGRFLRQPDAARRRVGQLGQQPSLFFLVTAQASLR